MDAEACVSSQRLKIDKEFAWVEWGLLTHRVWSLGWQLSRILKPVHNVHQVKQFIHPHPCCCHPEAELGLQYSVCSSQPECVEFLFVHIISKTAMHWWQISFHFPHSLWGSDILITFSAVSGVHHTDTVHNVMRSLCGMWECHLRSPIALSTVARFMWLLISTPWLVITGPDCSDMPRAQTMNLRGWL